MYPQVAPLAHLFRIQLYSLDLAPSQDTSMLHHTWPSCFLSRPRHYSTKHFVNVTICPPSQTQQATEAQRRQLTLGKATQQSVIDPEMGADISLLLPIGEFTSRALRAVSTSSEVCHALNLQVCLFVSDVVDSSLAQVWGLWVQVLRQGKRTDRPIALR